MRRVLLASILLVAGLHAQTRFGCGWTSPCFPNGGDGWRNVACPCECGPEEPWLWPRSPCLSLNAPPKRGSAVLLGWPSAGGSGSLGVVWVVGVMDKQNAIPLPDPVCACPVGRVCNAAPSYLLVPPPWAFSAITLVPGLLLPIPNDIGLQGVKVHVQAMSMNVSQPGCWIFPSAVLEITIQ